MSIFTYFFSGTIAVVKDKKIMMVSCALLVGAGVYAGFEPIMPIYLTQSFNLSPSKFIYLPIGSIICQQMLFIDFFSISVSFFF
jgi:hypothetical protein